MSRNNSKLFNMTITALLFAIVIILQTVGGSFKIGSTSFSFVLLPIVVGSITMGAATGGFLGLVFGVITVIAGITAQDFFTFTLIQAQPVFTVLVCLLKAVLAGVVPAFVYKALKEKNNTLAIFLASASAPIVNTLVFIVGGLLFFGDALTEAGFLGANTLLYFLVIGCAGINFIAELGINIIFAPAISRIINAFKSH